MHLNAIMKLFSADRKEVEGAWMGFEAEAWNALYIGTGLDPNEGATRPSVNVVFSSHRGGSRIYAPPDLLAMGRDPANRKRSERELVDQFYRTGPGNEHPWHADFLGSYRMTPSVGAEITLKWDALRLAAVKYAAYEQIPEVDALEALTRYVYLHELAHYFTHWGKRPDVVARGGAGEKVCEIEWRKNYFSWNSGGAECLKEGIAELACVTAFELRAGSPKWDKAAGAMKWLNGNLPVGLKEKYVDSLSDIRRMSEEAAFPNRRQCFWLPPALECFSEMSWDKINTTYKSVQQEALAELQKLPIGVTFSGWKEDLWEKKDAASQWGELMDWARGIIKAKRSMLEGIIEAGVNLDI